MPETQLDLNKITPAVFEVKKEEKKEHNLEIVPQKKSVFFVWFFGFLTLGIYSSIWYFKRAYEFRNLGTEKKLSSSLPTSLLVINIMLICSILIFPLTLTVYDMGVLFSVLSYFQMALLGLIGILLILKFLFVLINAYSSRKIINQALKEKGSKGRASGFFTLIFRHSYLQYEINRIMDDKEDRGKTGPWFFFILILVIAAAFSAYYLLGAGF